MSRSTEIANTILGQIRATDRMALWAWGSRKFIALPEEKNNLGFQLGGVMFNVSGAKYHGKVIIRLMGSDTYTVEIGRFYKNEWKRKDSHENVYCDELMNVIDGLVERDVA